METINIGFNDKNGQKQILDILLTLGYKWHGDDGHDSESIINNYPSYSNIKIDGNYLCMSGYYTNSHHWPNDSEKVLSLLTNHFKNETIIVKEVGDYSAYVSKDEVMINEVKISPAMLKEIYEESKKDIVSFDRFDITTRNADDSDALIGLLFSMGFTFYNYNLEETKEQFRKHYDSKVIKNGNTSIGGNGSYRGRGVREYFFPEDMPFIYNAIKNCTKTFTIGSYDLTFSGDNVVVGCQTINKSKVEEIYNALVEIGAYD